MAHVDPLSLLGDAELQLLCDAVADVIDGGYVSIDNTHYHDPAGFDDLKVRLEAVCEERGI